MRLVFAGTPTPALASLRTLVDSTHDVVAVITRPDAPAGRGRRLTPSPVGQLAEELGIDVLKPASVKDPQFLEALRSLAPDACPVVAYGALVPPAALDIPRRGWINLHFSLLPAWRGAAPVQHAIWHGDDITGATTFALETGLDTGPVYGFVTAPIANHDTAGSLLAELSESGAQLLLKTLDGIESGEVVPVPQPTEGISLAPKISIADARIDWRTPAIAVDRMVRACTPEPGAWTTLRDQRIRIGPVSVAMPTGEALKAGELQPTKSAVLVGTASGPVALSTVQAQGKREMRAADWARGLRIETGESFP
ncbi:MAG: methionyl-tRNA formyltransferase [Actinomycetes bacterium]